METRDLSLIDRRHAYDSEFYERVRARRGEFRPVETVLVPPFTGRGVRVKRGHSFRIVLVDGPQVADVGLWNAADPQEYFAAIRTWLLEGWFIRVGSRLWSEIPYLRPMATCIEDTVPSDDPEFHHHFIGTHCSPEWLELRTGIPNLNACHVNLLEAIQPFGLAERDIRDNFMVHQKVRLDNRDGLLHAAPSNGSPGDYVEFYAEIDLLVAVSVCPNGDNSRYWAVPGDNHVHPLRIEVLDTGIEPKEGPRWVDWRPAWRGSWLASEELGAKPGGSGARDSQQQNKPEAPRARAPETAGGGS